MKKLFLSVAVLCVTLFVQAKDYADYVSRRYTVFL